HGNPDGRDAPCVQGATRRELCVAVVGGADQFAIRLADASHLEITVEGASDETGEMIRPPQEARHHAPPFCLLSHGAATGNDVRMNVRDASSVSAGEGSSGNSPKVRQSRLRSRASESRRIIVGPPSETKSTRREPCT